MPSPTLHAAYAKHILHRHVLSKYNSRHDVKDNTELPHRTSDSHLGSSIPRSHITDKSARIGIVGGGVTGLAIAQHLQLAKYQNIEIFEASATCGGRCYTYSFTSDSDCPHNYYDVGAMRIPQISTMQTTLDLIDYLNAHGQNVKKAPYFYITGKEPNMYAYGQIDPDKDMDYNNFKSLMICLLEKEGFLTSSSKDAGDFDKSFNAYLNSDEQPDQYSTRAYLLKNGSTGLFDQAFMETICDFFDFQVADVDKVDWWRIDGGMSCLTDALYNVIKQGVTLTTNAAVTGMNDKGSSIDVTFIDPTNPASGTQTRTYDTVFNTTSFGCLQRMDLQGLSLDADTLTAIRGLSYDRATKVAIKFSTPWWTNLVKEGGVSGTDLPISNVVYPSWNDGDDKHHVAIMSYSWAQDATRMAALISSNGQESTDVNEPVNQLCLQNLVKLWSNTTNPPTLQELESSYLAHHAFAWSHEPNTAGGFALFGPGQFENLYPKFTKPLCNGKLWICGEAMSAHHAWISGALDSAAVAVSGFMHSQDDVEGKKILKESPLAGGGGENVAEMDETLLYMNVELALEEFKA